VAGLPTEIPYFWNNLDYNYIDYMSIFLSHNKNSLRQNTPASIMQTPLEICLCKTFLEIYFFNNIKPRRRKSSWTFAAILYYRKSLTGKQKGAVRTRLSAFIFHVLFPFRE
jgi:hypothetical protein